MTFQGQDKVPTALVRRSVQSQLDEYVAHDINFFIGGW